jgi:hypothetical protein
MNEEITLRDIIKAIVILKPGVTLAEAQMMIWAKTARSTMATAMHSIVDQGLFTTRRIENKGRPGFKCNAYYPTSTLLDSFAVTRDMMEYLGLTEVKLKPKKLKREDNTVFESCKQSAAMKRVLWFYGRGELPAI